MSFLCTYSNNLKYILYSRQYFSSFIAVFQFCFSSRADCDLKKMYTLNTIMIITTTNYGNKKLFQSSVYHKRPNRLGFPHHQIIKPKSVTSVLPFFSCSPLYTETNSKHNIAPLPKMLREGFFTQPNSVSKLKISF